MTPAQLFAAMKGKQPKTTAEPGRSKTGYRCTLKQRRTELGLTGQDVLDGIGHTGVAANAFHWEKDAHMPSFVDALKLAEFFGCKIEELWVKEPDAEPQKTATTTTASTQHELAS